MYVRPFTFVSFNETGPAQLYVHFSAPDTHHVKMRCVCEKKLLLPMFFVCVYTSLEF